MYASSKPLLDRPHRPLDFAHVAVRGYDVHFDKSYGVTDTVKLVIRMDVADLETASAV